MSKTPNVGQNQTHQNLCESKRIKEKILMKKLTQMGVRKRELHIPRKRQRKAQLLGAMSVPYQETEIYSHTTLELEDR